jgi:hypothetical protein
MEPSGELRDKLRETRTLTMDPSRKPGFCFIVDPPTDDPYEVYSVHYLPAVPERLTGDFGKEFVGAALEGITTKTDQVSGIRPFCFDFHAGDPTGIYRIEVFINRQLNASFELNVTDPNP